MNPNQASATITISDNFTIVCTTVATLVSPIGIDYHPPTQSLLVSFNYDTGETNNFALINTNGIVTNWSGVHGLPEEIKLTTVKTTANGFTNGDMYFGTGDVGGIGRLSANGAVSNLNWVTLSNEPAHLRGSLYVDQTGVFSNNLIAVTGDEVETSDAKGVWRIDADTNAVLIARIDVAHLEGVITLTNDVQKWGPWAGKIITGDETPVDENGKRKPVIYSIDTNGTVTSFPDLGIEPEDFDIIPPNQDLYCIDFDNNAIVKFSRTLLTNYWGDLLITQAGEFDPSTHPPKLFIVSWDSTNSVFNIRSFSCSGGHFEHVTFAPINIPDL